MVSFDEATLGLVAERNGLESLGAGLFVTALLLGLVHVVSDRSVVG